MRDMQERWRTTDGMLITSLHSCNLEVYPDIQKKNISTQPLSMWSPTMSLEPVVHIHAIHFHIPKIQTSEHIILVPTHSSTAPKSTHRITSRPTTKVNL